MKIVDSVYGVEEIEDDVLIDLINSKNIQRLKGVAQGGLPARYCAQPVFSRYDHSVGVMVLLRKIGADLNEQIAGILHDLSHTTFSHLIDWVIGDPKKQNYQDNQYEKVLRNSDCAKILEKYSFDVLDFIDIEKYKLLERETPDLCADRIDYCLRDLVARGRKKFSNEFIKHLIIHNGEIVFDSEPIAYQFAHEFLSLQNYSWAEVIHSTRFSIFAEVFKMNIEQYFKTIEAGVDKAYKVANAARAKGFDPANEVEIPIATTLAEKAVGLISVVYPQINDKRIVKRILELEEEHGQLDIAVAFLIAEEVAKEKYCKFENLIEAIDAGIRLGFSYFTLGVVSSPIEGFTGLKIGKTKEGKDYFRAYFSGPIRSAGTTASCVVLMLIDYLRESFGFAKYDPTEDEVKRYISENYDYHERVNNLQYLPTEEEASFLASHLPIQIAGEASEKLEVPNYKNLKRVDTNFLRSGVCLVLAEGLAQKAVKGFRLLNNAKKNRIVSTGFDWLEKYIKLHEKNIIKTFDKNSTPIYIKDLVAG